MRRTLRSLLNNVAALRLWSSIQSRLQSRDDALSARRATASRQQELHLRTDRAAQAGTGTAAADAPAALPSNSPHIEQLELIVEVEVSAAQKTIAAPRRRRANRCVAARHAAGDGGSRPRCHLSDCGTTMRRLGEYFEMLEYVRHGSR
jgi:hypothetical protein